MGDSKIRIAMLMTRCKKSGPTNQMLNILKYLDLDVFEAFLITLYKEDTEDSILNDYKKYIKKHYCLNISKKDVFFNRLKLLKNTIQELHINIIHSLGIIPDLAVFNIKFENQIITIRNFIFDDYPVKYGKVLGRIMSWIHLYILKKSKNVFACSESLAQKYKERLGLSLPFIRNGVDISKYKRCTFNEKINKGKELNLEVDKTILIYTGQINNRKNQGFLLKNFVQYREMKKMLLLILGTGESLEDLKNKYERNKNILFLGNVENVADYLRASDIYISTSKSEGMPNGVLEAMAAGLPVILSDIVQHKELFSIEQRIGMLYKENDSKDFLSTLDLLTNLEYSKYGKIAYETVRNNLSADKMSRTYQNKYIEVFEKASE